jgi:rare lipoprotein A (peptidoglycan hydrolase)
MQTKLRIVYLLFVASLLWTSPTSAANPPARMISNPNISTYGTVKVTSKYGPVSTPKKAKVAFVGLASWYGVQHQGKKMANGQGFDRKKLTAASWYFPLGTMLRVVNTETGESVVVTITDRGPNFRLNRTIDLSEAAAARLDYIHVGLTHVVVFPLPAFETGSAKLDASLVGPTQPMRDISTVAQLEQSGN